MPNPYAALKITSFRNFLAMRLCITIGYQIMAVAVGWQMFELTGDPLALGLIGLAEALPALGVSLPAGHIADSFERKKIVLASIAVLCIASMLLLYNVNKDQPLTELIYAAIFLAGIARGFFGPSQFALLPQLVPKEHFANAITWNGTGWQFAAVAGPAMGGLLYGFGGSKTTYMAVLTLIVLGFVVGRALPNHPLPEGKTVQSMVNSLKEGLRFVYREQIILHTILLDLFAVLFGGAVALLPIFAAEILHCGPEGLGILRASPAIGSVLTALYITRHPPGKGAGKLMLMCVAGFGLCIIAFGLSEYYFLSLFLLALSGCFDFVSVIIRSTLIHTRTPEHMKGRVSSVNNIFIGSSNEIGAFESGLTAKLMGTVPAVVFGGCMTLAVTAVAAIKSKKLRELDL